LPGRQVLVAANQLSAATRPATPAMLTALDPRPTTAQPAVEKSIAVLPFDSLPRDESTEMFADGVTEDIIMHLTKIRDLKVISRTSVMAYKGRHKRSAEIASELSVSTVLEGSVRRAGDRIRVTAQLIEAATDSHL